MILILHNIRSIHNVGSLFRTCDAAGCEKVYLCGITPAPIDRFGRPDGRFIKVSLGAEQSVAWEKKSRTAPLLRSLKKEGIALYALEQDKNSKNIFKHPFTKKQWHSSALIMGNEVTGLPKAVLTKSDVVFEIPQHGMKESLNVSVAAGIALFALRRTL